MTFVITVGFIAAACYSASYFLKLPPAEVLAPTLLSASLLLYVFGLFNFLSVGYFLLIAIVGFSAIWAIYRSGRQSRVYLLSLISPALVLFGVYALLTYLLTREMQMSSWDEFSHWGTVVKAMFLHDSLSPFNPVDLMFRSYPPAAGLFEYLVMKLAGTWHEGNLFWSYQLLVGAFFISFLSDLKWRSAGKLVLLMPLIALTPVMFFDSYSSIIIDPLLSVLFGYTIAMAITSDIWDWKRLALITVGLVTLVTMKDSGVFLACICLILIAIRLCRSTRGRARSSSWKQILLRIAVPAVLTAVGVLSWKLLLRVQNLTPAFSAPIDPVALGDTLSGEGPQYRLTVLKEFAVAFLGRALSTHVDGVSLTWVHWFAITLLLLAAISIVATRVAGTRFDWPSIVVLAFGAISYTAGLAVLYLFRFSEYEAVRLASFERYLSTYFAGVCTFAAMYVIWLVCRTDTQAPGHRRKLRSLPAPYLLAAVYLAFVAFVVPIGALMDLIGNPGARSQVARAPYAEVVAKAEAIGLSDEDRISVIAQHTKGGEYWILRYELLPASTLEYWSIGTPMDASDVWTNTEISPRRWASELERVDYVLLYSVNESFTREFADLFEDPRDITNNSVFRVEHRKDDAILVKAK